MLAQVSLAINASQRETTLMFVHGKQLSEQRKERIYGKVSKFSREVGGLSPGLICFWTYVPAIS
jgi:hypothetical protein